MLAASLSRPKRPKLDKNGVRNWAGCWAGVITLADDLVSHYQLFKYTFEVLETISK